MEEARKQQTAPWWKFQRKNARQTTEKWDWPLTAHQLGHVLVIKVHVRHHLLQQVHLQTATRPRMLSACCDWNGYGRPGARPRAGAPSRTHHLFLVQRSRLVMVSRNKLPLRLFDGVDNEVAAGRQGSLLLKRREKNALLLERLQRRVHHLVERQQTPTRWFLGTRTHRPAAVMLLLSGRATIPSHGHQPGIGHDHPRHGVPAASEKPSAKESFATVNSSTSSINPHPKLQSGTSFGAPQQGVLGERASVCWAGHGGCDSQLDPDQEREE